MAHNKVNLMVGKWIPSDRDALLKWARREFQKAIESKEYCEQYKEYRKYFPESGSVEEELSLFIKNATKKEELKKKINLHDSIINLIFHMGKESDIGMLIVQMFHLPEVPLALSVTESIFFLNYLLKYAPRFIDDASGKGINSKCNSSNGFYHYQIDLI